jgi:hypothetical protein
VNIAGATRSTLPITALDREQCGTYRCTVRNRSGAVHTEPALVSLKASVPLVRLQPVSVEVPYGAHATLSVKGALGVCVWLTLVDCELDCGPSAFLLIVHTSYILCASTCAECRSRVAVRLGLSSLCAFHGVCSRW